MQIKINKKDWEKLREHLKADIGYGEGGTFNIEKDGEWPADEKEIKKVEKIINDIDIQFIINKK